MRCHRRFVFEYRDLRQSKPQMRLQPRRQLQRNYTTARSLAHPGLRSQFRPARLRRHRRALRRSMAVL